MDSRVIQTRQGRLPASMIVCSSNDARRREEVNSNAGIFNRNRTSGPRGPARPLPDHRVGRQRAALARRIVGLARLPMEGNRLLTSMGSSAGRAPPPRQQDNKGTFDAIPATIRIDVLL